MAMIEGQAYLPGNIKESLEELEKHPGGVWLRSENPRPPKLTSGSRRPRKTTKRQQAAPE